MIIPTQEFTGLTSNERAIVTDLGGITYANGDILYYNNGHLRNLAIGTNGYLLTVTAGLPSWVASGGGTGTVTSVSVTTANGVSGSVATATTTPAITLTLGAITPTSVNGLTISTTTGTFTLTNAKTFAITNSLTLSGTDGTTMTFPTTSKTIAANDGSNWTFASQAIGDLVYASSTTAFTRLAAVAVGQVLSSAGTGTAPAWSSAPQITTIELGHASDTTLARVSAGVVSIEGVNIVTTSSTDTLTNKTLTTPVINGTITGTGQATAATVSTIMMRDSNANTSINNIVEGFTTTATAAGTTTLTITATFIQVFTGSSTQTVKLPTTSVLQGQQYLIINQSSGAVTVQSSGANTITILAAGTSSLFTAVVATPTTAANWSSLYSAVTVASGKVATINNTITFAGTDATTMTFPTTSATLARTDAANTFTGASTASAWVLTSPTITTGIVPTSNDGAALGSTSNMFSDLFLASGAVINLNNGDVTLTHSSNLLTFAGGQFTFGANTAYFTETDNGNSSTADTIDWTVSNKQKSTLTGNCTFTFTAPGGPCSLVLKLVQDGTGSRTVTWPATVHWSGGTAPTLTTTASKVDIITFYYDGTTYFGNSSLNYTA